VKDKPQEWMRLGLVQPMAYPDATEDAAKLMDSVRRICADPWFDVIELARIKSAELRSHVRETCQELGTAVLVGAQGSLLAGGLDLNAESADDRARAVELVKQVIDESAEMEAFAVAVLSGPDPGAGEREEAWKRLADSLAELAAHAADAAAMNLYLETFDRVPFGKNCLAGPTPEAVAAAESIIPDHPNFGIMLDLSHLPLLRETSQFALESAAACLKHAHAGNCVLRDPQHPTYGDNHPAFGIPEGENGAGELAEFLRRLRQIGYIAKGASNVLTFELKPFGGQEPEDVIANAKQTMTQAWEMLEEE